MTILYVSPDVEDMQGKVILVFLRPEGRVTNWRFHPWRVVKGPAMSTETLEYRGDLSVRAIGCLGSTRTAIAPPLVAVQPGVVYQASAAANGRVRLEAEPSEGQDGEAVVVNALRTGCELETQWFVDERRVATAPSVTRGRKVRYKPVADLFFTVAEPEAAEREFRAEDLAAMAYCPLYSDVKALRVVLTRDSASWQFDFQYV